MIISFIGIISFLLSNVLSQSQSRDYVGKYLGEFNSYHHQVGGEVYAVDEYTFLIKNFIYDGNGKDTFFWAGSRPRSGPQGFLVPDEYGRTNILESYLNKDIKIRLADGKRITDIKWLAVYDLTRLEPFGDIYIPEGFEPPKRVILPKFKSRAERVFSGDVTVEDSKTLYIEKFYFDGRGEVYFWIGVGPQPHSRGTKIPDEHGYMTPLRRYAGSNVVLTLPGERDVFNTDWLALYDVVHNEVLGHVIIPEDLSVPPSLITITPRKSPMKNCEQLHRNFQIAWNIFGGIATLQIAVKMNENDYAAFGLSGSETEPKMVGGDAVMLYRDTYNGYVKDINMTSYFPCTVLYNHRTGVCEDDVVGGTNDYQPQSGERKDGISVFNFRRPLVTPDADKDYKKKGPMMIIWAMGKLTDVDQKPKPTMHFAWSKVAQPLDFGRDPPRNNCFAFTHTAEKKLPPWKPVRLTHPSSNLTFQLGPDGGPRGYSAITKQVSVTGLSWYVDGFLVPEIYLRRDTTYTIYVYGGSNAFDHYNYHPLIITNEPHGAYSQMREEQKKSVRIFAGLEHALTGEVRPVRAGELCKWQHPIGQDRRRDSDFNTFVDFRNSLQLSCGDKGSNARPSILKITPDRTWPDMVYYNSWTGQNMGWKIHIIDKEQ